MSKFWFVAILLLASTLTSRSASGCFIDAQIDIHDVQYSDVVVIGKIANYKIVLDPVARQSYKKSFGNSPDLAKRLTGSFISDYARFDISVDEVLRGKASKTLNVTWDNSTFGEPQDMSPGPFLIALRQANSPIPPLRGPSATYLPNPDPSVLTVLQAPCAPPLIFESQSMETGLIRRVLSANPK